ncbi:MAG: LacI family DNA-binding transcriptional regulator [Opitutales bacterium]|nr:LacI family DNA-binding transcriptional regulator [Opitutales bacterium]NRA28307.1 LacI family DNA-binding transcriptional regulator [Opitutales bacterium]
MKASRKPNIRDIAAHLGISKSTVHRALSGLSRVSDETRTRVEDAARELGFERDLTYSTLSKQRQISKTKRTLIYYLRESPQANEPGVFRATPDLSKYFDKHKERMGFEVEKADPDLFKHPSRLIQTIYHRGCSGIIAGHCKREIYQAIVEFGKLPAISFQTQVFTGFHSICHNQQAGVFMCWHKLWEKGYRRIGLASMRHHPVIKDDLQREMAMIALRQKYGEAAVSIPPLYAMNKSREPYLIWLESYKPDAIIGFSPWLWYELQKTKLAGTPFVLLHARDEGKERHLPGALQSKDVLAFECLRKLEDIIKYESSSVSAYALDTLVPPRWHEGAGIPDKKD